MPEPVAIDYKTHILIGVSANGVMTVIADWPHVPRQLEVQEEIDQARDGYTTFVLCTPTSILSPDSDGEVGGMASANWAWPPVRLEGVERREGEPQERWAL